MTCTIVCQVVDSLGCAAWWWTGDFGGRHLEEIRSHPSASFDDLQPSRIAVELGHEGRILGEVLYLEHGLDGCEDVSAVCTLPHTDPDEVDGLYCSALLTGVFPGGSLISTRSTIDALALVEQTAGVCARPIRVFDGDLWKRHSWPRPPKILERAFKAGAVERRSSTSPPLRIHRPSVVDVVEARAAWERPAVRTGTGRTVSLPDGSRAELEHSAHGGRIIHVR